jgi:hypothetical protein
MTELEREKKFHDIYRGQVDDLTAELERVKAERDEAVRYRKLWTGRTDVCARRLDKALSALREATTPPLDVQAEWSLRQNQGRLRAALAEIEAEK